MKMLNSVRDGLRAAFTGAWFELFAILYFGIPIAAIIIIVLLVWGG